MIRGLIYINIMTMKYAIIGKFSAIVERGREEMIEEGGDGCGGRV